MRHELRDESAPDHVRLTDRRERFRGPIFTIYDDEIEFASGDVARRQWMDHADAVAVVALRPAQNGGGGARPADSDADGEITDPGEGWEVLLIRQYRHSPRRLMWEIPAGLCDAEGEAEVLTAARELREETDLGASRWYRLINFVTSPGVSNEDLGIYLAFDIEPAPLGEFTREAEEAEIIVEWFNLREVTDAIFAGVLTSPTLVSGVLAANVALARGLERFTEVVVPIENN